MPTHSNKPSASDEQTLTGFVDIYNPDDVPF